MAHQHRTPSTPVLLSRSQAAARMGMNPRTWDDYWWQHLDLVLAVRVIRLSPASRGVRRWPSDVLDRHIEQVCR